MEEGPALPSTDTPTAESLWYEFCRVAVSQSSDRLSLSLERRKAFSRSLLQLVRDRMSKVLSHCLFFSFTEPHHIPVDHPSVVLKFIECVLSIDAR